MTEIVMIVDRSYSMYNIAAAAANAMNNYINEQKNGVDSCYVTVWEFDNYVEKQIPRTKIEECPKIKLVPRGDTRLYDAIGIAIKDMEAALKKARKKKTVLFVIQTDGGENSSREFTLAQVQELVKSKSEKGWQFIFLGANFMDKQAKTMGFNPNATAGFAQTAVGYSTNYGISSRETTNLRKASSKNQAYSISMK